MEYRAEPHGDIWHFSPTCSRWPETPFNVLWLDKPPTFLKLCPECVTLMPGVTAPKSELRADRTKP